MDILSYLMGKQSAGGGGGGGGKEAYAIGFNFGGAVELQPGYLGKEYTPGSGAIEPSDDAFTVSKGDTLYLLWWELSEDDEIPVRFSNDSLELQDLLAIPASDFTLDTDGETYYTQITIPSVDLNGDDWGGTGYITVFAPYN